MGGFESFFSGKFEPTVRYHSSVAGTLIFYLNLLTKKLFYLIMTPKARETPPGCQFDWGGRLLKGNGGVQRFSQTGWKSVMERKGTREPDCETLAVEQRRKSVLVILYHWVESLPLNG